METLTIEEARALYHGRFRDIALKFFSEEQLLNDFTLVRNDTVKLLKKESTPSLMAMEKLWSAFIHISKGREIHSGDRLYVYFPYVVLAECDNMLIGKSIFTRQLYVNNMLRRVHICVKCMSFNEIVKIVNSNRGELLVYNLFTFSEEVQADYFAKEFWQELTLVSLPFENIDFNLQGKGL